MVDNIGQIFLQYVLLSRAKTVHFPRWVRFSDNNPHWITVDWCLVDSWSTRCSHPPWTVGTLINALITGYWKELNTVTFFTILPVIWRIAVADFQWVASATKLYTTAMIGTVCIIFAIICNKQEMLKTFQKLGQWFTFILTKFPVITWATFASAILQLPMRTALFIYRIFGVL